MTWDALTAPAERFAERACLTYSGEHVSRRQQAEERLAASPDLVGGTIYPAAAAYDAAAG